MGDNTDLDTLIEEAWVGFRARLADHLVEMADDAVVFIEYAARTTGDPEGSQTPGFVRVSALGCDLIHVEDGLRSLGGVFERRRADEVAVLVVRSLREGYGVPHPSFVEAGGLEVDPSARPARHEAAQVAGRDDRDLEGNPDDRDHLVAMVDAALGRIIPDLEHDADGDIPIVSGSSVLFVEVLRTRPSVRLFAEIVVDPDAPDAPERLDHEVALLNRLHPLWKFSHHEGRVHMAHEMPARPFVAATLRMLVRRFLAEVDQIAAGLVVRVGGRLYLEPAPAEDERDVVMAGLLELLHLERVRATTVAGLFDHDRLEIIRQLVRIRRGEVSCEGHDEDVVLEALRKALRVVADGEPAARSVPADTPRRTVQEPLLQGPEGLDAQGGDETLDLGWSA